MKRYYILKDGTIIAATANKDEAVYMVRQYQKRETHYILRSEFSIIYGEEEFVGYERK